MSYETQHETNLAPGTIANQGEYESGKLFCVQPGEFEEGQHCTERRILPEHLQAMFNKALFGDESPDADRRIVAEDTAKIVTSVDGNTIRVADLFYNDDNEPEAGVVSSKRNLTAEGWIIPAGLSIEDISGYSDSITGYFLPVENQGADEGLEAEESAEESEEMALVIARPRKAEELKMLPGYVQPPDYNGREY